MRKWLLLLADIFGWYGVAAILGTYGLLSMWIMKPETFVFQFLNFSGSISVGLVAYLKRNHQSVAVNAVWALIGLMALLRIFLR